ncbi:MAG TPA: M18 family aminopeptidase [Kofleriaceae bacterium]|nr:M18 family aminopeptidase [Kofleriaceae bacterium]
MISLLADLLGFLGASPTPFHAVDEGVRRLEAAGFRPLLETARWDKLDAGAYYVTTSGTNLFGFRLPAPEHRTSFRIIGAHTDSPNLRLKPSPEYVAEGYTQLGVEVYGGVLLNSWLDRDLGLAGRVLVREGSGAVGSRLVRVDQPVLRIPQLAIHLDREVNDKGLILNRQEHLAPILGLAGSDAGSLARLVADTAQVAAERVVGHELMLYDLTPPAVGGQSQEFIFSARLDNLAMCHAALTALASADPPDAIAAIALFDHEEVGSASAAGAGSAVLPRILERLVPDREAFHQACARSTCISADMSHAVHPNYAGRHEPRHKPQLNGGPVIKTNTQQRYATTAATAAMFAELCREVDVPVQHYAHRTDLPCGSTIGPITSTLLGIPTVDVGNPMLSMHSAREMGGSRDPDLMARVLARYLRGSR